MKTSALTVLTTALLAGNAFAQTTPPDKGQAPAAKPGMGAMDMMQMMMDQMMQHQQMSPPVPAK